MNKQLTSQKEALFLEYQDKWRKIALSTEPINKEKAKAAVKDAYTLIASPQPEVIICWGREFLDPTYSFCIT